MQKLLIIIFSIFTASSTFTKAWWGLNSQKIKKSFEENSVEKTNLIKRVLKHRTFSKINFTSILGKGGYGFVFGGFRNDQEEVSVKIHFEKSKNYSLCTSAYEAYSAIAANPKIKYIVKIEKPIKFWLGSITKTKKTKVDYFCAFVMEKGNPADKVFFRKPQINKKENTKKIVGFLRKVVEAFATLNFEGSFMHADVKPENLLFIKTRTGFEPRIIDFDLTFQQTLPTINHGNVIYTTSYRPPELLKIVPDTNPANKSEENAMKEYKFDPLLREEAWALGMTMQHIIRTNLKYLNLTNRSMNFMLDLIELMTTDIITERISTWEAWEIIQENPVENIMII